MASAPDDERENAPLHETQREQRFERAWSAVVVLGSLALHVALATSLGRGQARPEKTARAQTRIEIAVRRPPPPAPPTPPPPVEAPPPPRAEPERPRPARPAPEITPPAEVAAPPVSAEGTIAPSDAPTSDAPSAMIAAPAAVEAPAPVHAPAPAAPQRVEAREGANYSHNPRPAYPRVAQREEWEGTVTLRVNVQPNGRPSTIRVQRSSGHDVLDEAAREAVADWTFTPATVDGVAAPGWVTVPIVFRLGR